jgi:hypothetical protein
MQAVYTVIAELWGLARQDARKARLLLLQLSVHILELSEAGLVFPGMVQMGDRISRSIKHNRASSNSREKPL